MGKQKKNSNYLTKWAEEHKRRKEEDEIKKKRKNTTIAVSAISAVLVIGIVLGLGFGVFGWGKPHFKVTHYATIEIENYGTVELELYGKEAPITVESFVKLANSGYFNGLSFYGIQSSENGVEYLKGGKEENDVEAIYGEYEYNDFNNAILHKKGVISMANAGHDKSAPNNFFIIVSDSEQNSYIDGEFAAFGKVVKGMSIIEHIHKNAKPYDSNGGILPASQPIITKLTVKAAD